MKTNPLTIIVCLAALALCAIAWSGGTNAASGPVLYVHCGLNNPEPGPVALSSPVRLGENFSVESSAPPPGLADPSPKAPVDTNIHFHETLSGQLTRDGTNLVAGLDAN